MSILFVLLTFLLILTVMYFRRPQEVDADTLRVAPPKKLAPPILVKQAGFDVPQGYNFHPGHTWVVDEGRQNARVGIDAFAGNLFGKIDAIEVADVNRWVRQGQPLCTVASEGRSVEMLSPVEGVLVAVNHALTNNPDLVVKDPYVDGWICQIKAPEMKTNFKNLLQGPIVLPWMENCLARLAGMLQQLTPDLAQDGGLPVKGLLFQVDPKVQQQIAKEFFLT